MKAIFPESVLLDERQRYSVRVGIVRDGRVEGRVEGHVLGHARQGLLGRADDAHRVGIVDWGQRQAAFQLAQLFLTQERGAEEDRAAVDETMADEVNREGLIVKEGENQRRRLPMVAYLNNLPERFAVQLVLDKRGLGSLYAHAVGLACQYGVQTLGTCCLKDFVAQR